MITQQTKSKSLFELFKERVIINFGDYFCCIHIFSAKLFVCSQTFVSRKYIQKLEISYEFDVRLIFTPMNGGFATGPQAQNRWCMRQLVYIENCMGKSPIVKNCINNYLI